MKKCQICGKIGPTMFITQIVQGEVTELHLCEACAKERGLLDPVTLSFNEKFFPENFQQQIEHLLKKVEKDVSKLGLFHHEEEDDTPLMTCPICQFTLSNYRKTGRVGCPDCYRVFASHLDGHFADAPSASQPPIQASPQLQIKKLEHQMAKAIEVEDYETAASLRDQIKTLQQQG